ncbi:glycosyltransferase family 4 protein [Carnobacterium gallinarum]|uniref:glycosyltransferase family 4 protein n=1 Tax=Carnobacterium gallinarum TaxID=2749 RepID=UPI000553459D|nr:glycosyltransferase family 4 protein [Carnobacterium gallinarum]
MNIGIFTDTYFPQVSGVATSIRTLKEELNSKGHHVTIFTTTDPKADLTENHIIRLTSIPLYSFKDRRIAIGGTSLALKKAKELNLDIIHTHTEFSLGFIGKHVAEHLDIPLVHTYHTMYEDYLHYIAKGKILRPNHVKLLSRYFCNQTVGVIAPSERVLNQLEEYGVEEDIQIIPTGVKLNQFKSVDSKRNIRKELDLTENQPVILSLSRLSKEKNTEAILLAMPELLIKEPQLQLVIVGKGPRRETLEKLAQELKIQEHIYFLGEKPSEEVANYYQMADLFVSASESESQGLTYIEAIASGTNIVAKENAYTRELVKENQFGALFMEDKDLARTILEALANVKRQNNMVGERNQLLSDISSQTFGERVIRFYEDSGQRYQLEVTEYVKSAK